MKSHAIGQVHKLYGPAGVIEKMYLPSNQKGELIQDIEWRAFVHIKSFALPGTWGIHLFFGQPPENSSDWFMAENRVGTVNVLNNPTVGASPNCQKQSQEGQLITGLVLLSNELKGRNIEIKDRKAVMKFLAENLTWRIAKDAKMCLSRKIWGSPLVCPLERSSIR